MDLVQSAQRLHTVCLSHPLTNPTNMNASSLPLFSLFCLSGYPHISQMMSFYLYSKQTVLIFYFYLKVETRQP